jgi:hypothetical protein
VPDILIAPLPGISSDFCHIVMASLYCLLRYSSSPALMASLQTLGLSGGGQVVRRCGAATYHLPPPSSTDCQVIVISERKSELTRLQASTLQCSPP